MCNCASTVLVLCSSAIQATSYDVAVLHHVHHLQLCCMAPILCGCTIASLCHVAVPSTPCLM